MKLRRPSIIISANSLWNISNFRSGLMRALEAEGLKIIIAAPPANDTEDAPSRDFFAIPMDRSGINPFADVRVIARFVALLGRYRPMALLSFTIKPNIYGSLAARLRSTPAIPNVSGLGTAFIRGGLLAHFVSALYRLAFAKCPAVFFQNPDDLKLFVRRRIVRRAQARLVPGSGIDLDRFQAVALPDGDPVLLFIGRLLADKGVREFVEAAELVRSRFPRVRFQILGDLDEENRTAIALTELERWVADGTIEYLGPTDDVRPHIAAATAVVLPSYREGLPRTLLEGAAVGRPLIATDVPGCREIVTHNVTGLLCQARSGTSLAEAMAHFIEMDVDQRRALGDAARARVESTYEERKVIAAYLEVIRPLMGSELQ